MSKFLVLKVVAILTFTFPVAGFSMEFSKASLLIPFTSDGCSMFPDGGFTNNMGIQNCCVKHDVWYWMGGTEQEREQADLELYNCVVDLGHKKTADLMYPGIRMGGTPDVKTSWRWGYGWTKLRPYGPLNSTELEQVEKYWNLTQIPAQIRAFPATNDLFSILYVDSCGEFAVDQLVKNKKGFSEASFVFKLKGAGYRLQIFSESCPGGYYLAEFESKLECLRGKQTPRLKKLEAFGTCQLLGAE